VNTSTLVIRKNKWLILTIFLGLIFRLIDIARPFSGLGKWNEGHYSITALNHFNYGIFLTINEYGLDLTTSPLFSWLIYFSFRIFGVHEWAARIPSLFFGMISLILVYLIAEKLYGYRVGLAATFIAAISPGVAYFSRNIQLESTFTAFALAALLFLIYYKDGYDIKWLIASGVNLSIAILTKYPAILVYPALIWVWFKQQNYSGGRREINRLLLYILLPVLPSLLWLYFAFSTNFTLTTWYFNKPEVIWNLGTAKTAFYLAIVKFIPEHFGYVFYIPFLLTFIWILKDLKRHMAVFLFTFSWFLLIFAFPDFYLSNMYYHYPMLYGMSILLGYFVVVIAEKFGKCKTLEIGRPIIVLLVLVISLYQYNIYFHSYYTDFSEANEISPFQSAIYVAEINSYHDLVVTDLPPTMFYLGGDPGYIKLAYTTQGLINAVKEDKYIYLVTYYAGNRTLNETLQDYNYTQIAPRAWKKSN
jgi:4-amino-4-deoxy-L-arabinose transferase-like glycosyltransferase